MCGLVGLAGELAFKDEVTMKRLLVLDVFRGPDSTGLASVSINGDVKVAKTPSNPWDLFDMNRFKVALNGNNSKVFLGHNRAATRGGVTHGNAHPFEIDHIVGAHNGTLDYTSWKALEDAVGEKFSVDSQALIAGIAKLGVKGAIDLCSEGKDGTTGAWALVWYDSMEGSLNFLRNKWRPLWYGFTKDFKRLFWASEWPMIEAAARLGVGYDLFMDDQGHRFWQFDDNVHHRFDVEFLKKGSETRPKPVAKLVKGKEPLPVVTAVPLYDPFGRGQTGGNNNVVGFHKAREKLGSGTNSTTTSRGNKEPSIVHLLGDLHNPFGGLLDKENFDELAKYGCSWCQADVEWGDMGCLVYERDGIILCPGCVKGDSDEGPSTRVYTKQDLS